jgi:NADPH:quinone reductase-like Zn-dependent oxidoreductase
MKASCRIRYGGPQILEIIEKPKPVPGSGELLIRVVCTTVNRTDCGVLSGAPYIFRFFAGWPNPRHSSTGTDFAGVVEATGPGVSRFSEGERVWGFHDHGIGSHAEYFVIRESFPVLRIPDHIGFAEAAASAEGAHYAFNYLRCMHLEQGTPVLVNGATGAIGSAAVQMLRVSGAKITAVCHAEHADRVKALGADRVVACDRENFTATGERYAYVLDAVGKSSFGACRNLLLDGGAYFSSELGPGNENLYLPLTTRFSRVRMLFPLPAHIRRSLERVQELLTGGQFHPLIDRTYSLEELPEAFRYVASGKKIGNVILQMSQAES